MSALTRRGSHGMLEDWLSRLSRPTQAKITVARGILTIQAERPEEDGTGHSEFRYGSFCRKVAFPGLVLGSTAHKVIHLADRPVLVVR